jgi:Asp/Glu/hydantoin racemase
MQAAVNIPVVRIDSAMAEEAVQRATRIGVAATLPTTLQPTTRQLQEKAAELHKPVDIRSQLIEGAFARLSAGDRAGHDALLVEGLAKLASEVDVVVLAQASMARVVPQLPASTQEKFLSSPRSGILRVKSLLRTPQNSV